MDQLKCITLNVRGLRDGAKRSRLINYLNDNKVNIVFLQETFCTQELESEFLKEWKGKIYHSFSSSNHARGVCILISDNIKFDLVSEHKDKEGRLLLLNICINESDFSLLSVYSPNKEKERVSFIKDTSDWCSENVTSPSKFIVGGDFNCALETIDRKMKHQKDKSHLALKQFLASFNLVDSWRLKNKSTTDFTYIDPSNRGYDSRIDYIFIPHILKDKITQCYIKPAPVPDHKAVNVILNMCEKNRGSGYWKLNTNVLTDDLYVKGIEEIIDRTISDYIDAGNKIVWELCKLRIKEFSVAYCKEKQKSKKCEKKMLEQKINMLDGFDDELSRKERSECWEKLNILYCDDAKGAQIRARAQYIEEGERNTKYFLSLETKRQKSNAINSLKVNGVEHTDDKELLQVIADFYDDLYKSKSATDEEVDKYLSRIQIENVLTDDLRDSIEGKITYDECAKALKCLKLNKSPGLDGLPAEFYKKIWDKLNTLIVDAYNESYDEQILIESQRKAVISLIFKKGDAQLLTNYRPISVTCVDYKILAFCLSNRLQSVIKHIVHPGQVAYIKGRFIGTNIRLIQDILEFTDEHTYDALYSC